MKIIPAIMSGGSGTRLWPLSTPQKPKQFHALGQAHSMIQATALRFIDAHGSCTFLPPIVLAGEDHGQIAADQLAAVGLAPQAIALEPEGRNTAATALVAALMGADLDPEALVLLLPADHVMTNVTAFLDAVARAAPFAQDHIVTFGIQPTAPATGYGYIKSGDPLGAGVFAIQTFLEKPSLDVAQTLFQDPAFTWNAGVFLFSPAVVLKEFEAVSAIAEPVRTAYAQAARDGVFVRLPAAHFSRAQALPFDIAIMQETTKGAVTPCDVGWADIGSWAELWRLSAHDDTGNAVQGAAVCEASSGCLVVASGTRVAVRGLQDVMVIATPDGVLVLPRSQAQEVKGLAAKVGALDPRG